MRKLALTMGAALLGSCCACSSSPTAQTTANGTDINYLMSSAIVSPDTYSGLVFPLESVTVELEADRAGALEVAEGGWVFGIPGSSSFLVSRGAQLTRWSVTDGVFSEGATLSMARLGVTEIRTARVVDEGHAWVAVGSFVVELDPTTMEIVKTTEFPQLDREGWTTSASLNGENYLRPGSLVFTFTRWNFDTFESYPEIALANVDLATGDVQLMTREGCGDLDSGFVDDDGTLWIATGTRAVLQPLVEEDNPRSCLIRLPEGVNDLSIAEVTDLREATNAVVANVMPYGQGTALVRALDETRLVLTEDSTFVDVARSDAWGWAELDLETFAVTPLTSLPPAPAITSMFKVDNRPLIGVSTSDFAATTFYLATPDEARPTVTIPGAPLAFVDIDR